MKQLLTGAALVLLAAPALAQVPAATTSEVNQTSSTSEADIIQINYWYAPGQELVSVVNQDGTEHTATVRQTHDGSLAGERLGLVEAYIDQSGAGNTAEQTQGPSPRMGSSYARISQSGTNSRATQHQVLHGNSAEIEQEGGTNVAHQEQDTGLSDGDLGGENQVTLSQQDGMNTARQEQHGWSNVAEGVQTGPGNTAVQTQAGNLNYATFLQDGNDHSLTQSQTGSLNQASSEQWGQGGTVEQTQVSSHAGGGDFLEGGDFIEGGDYFGAPNQAMVRQLGGSYHEAYQSQTSSGVGLLPNVARIWQEGIYNIASQTQRGAANLSLVNQDGSRNTVSVVQQTGLLPD